MPCSRDKANVNIKSVEWSNATFNDPLMGMYVRLVSSSASRFNNLLSQQDNHDIVVGYQYRMGSVFFSICSLR